MIYDWLNVLKYILEIRTSFYLCNQLTMLGLLNHIYGDSINNFTIQKISKYNAVETNWFPSIYLKVYKMYYIVWHATKVCHFLVQEVFQKLFQFKLG